MHNYLKKIIRCDIIECKFLISRETSACFTIFHLTEI